MTECNDRSERKYELRELNAHCTQIILAEIQRRGLSVRALNDRGIIKCRKSFKQRLEQGWLWSGELSKLLEFLEIDLVHALTTFLAREPLDAYSSGAFRNFTMIMTALIQQHERPDHAHLSEMDELRPQVVDVMATKIYEQLASHQSRIDTARNLIPARV